MPKANPMKELYGKLAAFGMPRAWVRSRILPSWWDDEAALDEAGFAEAVLIVAQRTGLTAASLMTSDSVAEAKASPVRFKKPSAADESELEVARVIATQLARTVAPAIDVPVRPLPSTLELREILLENRSWFDLRALVEHLWAAGVPVLLTTSFPKGAKKPDALVVDVEGRKVIVLTSGRTSAPWLLFFVAHELGHIALGHLQTNSTLIDARLDRDDSDEEERAANDWAVALLSGAAGTQFVATSRWPKADQLAREAQLLATKTHTDPGFIVLNYAYSMGQNFYPVAAAALKLMPETMNADQTLHRIARTQLDFSKLTEDAAEYVSRMMGAVDEEAPVSVA